MIRVGCFVGVWVVIAIGGSGCEKRSQSAKAVLKESMTLDLGDDVTMELVKILPGTFEMKFYVDVTDARGVRRRRTSSHPVTLGKPFYMGVYEVTVPQFKQFWVDSGREESGEPFPKRRIYGKQGNQPLADDDPMTNVMWAVATEYCKWASEKTGMDVSLPSEAQWEYACRAGSPADFCFGYDEANLNDYAWYLANSNQKPHPVGLKKPNAWGLYDMHGNVGEWCRSWFGPDDESSAEDPTKADGVVFRVQRGGCFLSRPRDCRSTGRAPNHPDGNLDHGGFRVVVTPRDEGAEE